MSARWPGLTIRLRAWMVLIGVVVGVGWLQVVQRNAILVTSYAVADRMHRLHEQDTNVVRLDADVVALASPAALARVAKERRLTLVAWSTVDHAHTRRSPAAAGSPIQMAADAKD